MENLVTVAWLLEHLQDDDVVVVDIRGSVGKEDLGGGRQKATYAGHKHEYNDGHIPGAVFIDWTKDIVDPNADVKAQIAQPDAFAKMMESRGIGSDSCVIVVDHNDCHIAARLWWALKYMGHDGVAMLDGGYAAWIAAGGEMTAELPGIRDDATFIPAINPALRVEWQDVLGVVEHGGAQLIDVRGVDTFNGETQRGGRGGHIPGAINLPAADMVHEDGTWRSADEIREMAAIAGIDLDKPIITYCNGGVTAAQGIVGLELAGATVQANYDGSWNEWGERADLPVESNRDLFGVTDSVE